MLASMLSLLCPVPRTYELKNDAFDVNFNNSFLIGMYSKNDHHAGNSDTACLSLCFPNCSINTYSIVSYMCRYHVNQSMPRIRYFIGFYKIPFYKYNFLNRLSLCHLFCLGFQKQAYSYRSLKKFRKSSL